MGNGVPKIGRIYVNLDKAKEQKLIRSPGYFAAPEKSNGSLSNAKTKFGKN